MSKILYVEDNHDTAEAVQILLENEGHEVDLAYNGNDGIALSEKNPYDLILLDIMLPDMSGWDIFARLNKKLKTKFAFLSAIPVSSERLSELRKAGVSDYIMKPFTKADLTRKVNNIVEKIC